MPDPWEMDWGAAPQAAAPAAFQANPGKAPWEMDWSGHTATPEQAAPHSLMDRLGNITISGMAKSTYDAARDAFTLPGDVYSGKVKPGSDEELDRARGAAMLLSPGSAALKGGEGVMGVPLVAKSEPTAGLAAAKTADELGAPLPRGLASDSKIMQATTKAAQQLPLVGPKIGEQAAKTVEAAGGRVNDIADQMASGVVDRASTGAALRPSIKGVIESNNSRIDDAFLSLRNMLDQSGAAELPITEKTLKQIVGERTAAGQTKPKAGLEDIHNLVDQGATFDGLQRARSDIGNTLNFGAANPGFNGGDLKRVYAALSRDMEGVAGQSAKEGVAPQAAVQALKDANATSAPIIEFNKTLQKLSGIKSDESLVGSLTKAAQDKTGNVKLLAQLRNTMPKEDFEQIGGVALSELGHSASTNRFSLNQFATKWNGMGDRAKSVLFSPEHKQVLDNIASMGVHLKDADKFANTSNTAGSAAWGKLIAGGAGAIAALTYGDPTKLIMGLAAAGGGMFLARQLAKPATASSIAKWTRAAVLAEHGQSPSRLAAFRLSTQNLLRNLSPSDQSRTNLQQSRMPLPQ